ncbi:MAG: UDP-N-acetylmuramate dehydrogenase [Gammaproteobacteria bacterium]|nr:UDP-N-acetylmuramate dehydrogenase [Gammaproteobacteria bacterium]
MAKQFDAAVCYEESMSRHTSWRVGGNADVFFTPQSRTQLIEFLQDQEADIPLTWVGLGSNLLVRDGGIRGVVIAIGPALGSYLELGDGVIEVEAGLACTVLARKTVRLGLGPAEFFAGIPGTIGGALSMNAGAFGGETWDKVKDVDVINRQGEIVTRQAGEYEIAYRHVIPPANDEWFLAARFKFDTDSETDMSRVTALIQARREKQPLGLPSCGSVFRNPEGDYSARLIEACGLKGFRIGGAEVSPKHANFIINTGDATAADIEALIIHVRTEVEAKHGVLLRPEVRIVGDAL